MIEGVIVKELKKYDDDRGWLIEIYRNDMIDYKPAMSYISETNPGVARGPHEHKYQSDCFAFVGPGTFKVYLWDNREASQTNKEKFIGEFGEAKPGLVIIPPGVVHGYKCVSDIPGRVINFPNKLYRGEGRQEEVDEIRWEDKKDSPFKIK